MGFDNLCDYMIKLFNEQAINLTLFKGEDGIVLTNMHCIYLSAINAKPNTNMAELTEKIKVHKSTSTRTIGQLEKWGYVVRRPNSKDQRKYDLTLTDKGHQVYMGVRERLFGEFCVRAFGNFHPDELETAEHILGKMVENLTI